ncbi:MAG: hypothetical protein A2826_00005 [Candidatus Doudnabacteria bacterium RIFCSPHIGHO2_01_FULL_43_23]|uniref:Uncharacterized protein n=1 Tax=Candidatus Doudnabacteria bacterium RIFCSPHIGHO2_01_FULL_43_23 TaxID=1817822 RepID=A0A1F5NS02_9BACT|nr:MAG: hypothetical protein A2826_00005 [Candidatus Doudnabacteria bacterium RIFCSPHIGHO2_01_FULL_43_23]
MKLGKFTRAVPNTDGSGIVFFTEGRGSIRVLGCSCPHSDNSGASVREFRITLPPEEISALIALVANNGDTVGLTYFVQVERQNPLDKEKPGIVADLDNVWLGRPNVLACITDDAEHHGCLRVTFPFTKEKFSSSPADAKQGFRVVDGDTLCQFLNEAITLEQLREVATEAEEEQTARARFAVLEEEHRSLMGRIDRVSHIASEMRSCARLIFYALDHCLPLSKERRENMRKAREIFNRIEQNYT